MNTNPTKKYMSRRAFLNTALYTGGAIVLAACGAPAQPAATTAPAAPAQAVATSPAGVKPGGKLLAWGIVSFTKDGDALLGQQMAEWGKANNTEVEYVALPGSDYTAKVAAAVETGAIPDVVMFGGTDSIYYASKNKLVDMSDVFGKVKGLAGGMYSALEAPVSADGKTYGIPMQADVSVLYTRLDLVEQATGKRVAPTTIDEMDAIMRKQNNPPKTYGYGAPLGLSPDANSTLTWILLNDGGTLVDKDGKPAINNPGTVSALTRIQTWWKDKLIPPDAPAADDSTNNKWYQSRQAVFVTNPASIFAFLEQNDKDLLAQTDQAILPTGKAGTYPGAGTWAWSIFKDSKNIDAAKTMITAIMQPDKLQAVYEKVGGRWFPVYRDLANAKWWKDRPYFNSFPKMFEAARPGWYPATATPKLLTQLSAANQKYLYASMLQEVTVNNKAPADVAKEGQTKMEQIFAEAAK